MNRFSLSIIVTAAFFIFSNGFSQVKSDSVKTNPYKWEVGIDFFSLLTSGNSDGVNLIVKKNYQKDNNKEGAYRLQFSVSSNIYTNQQRSVGSVINSQSDGNSNFYSLSLGKEWQVRYGNFLFYYGADAGFGIARSRRKTPNISQIDTDGNTAIVSYTESVSRSYSSSVTGFLGAKFFIIPRLSLAIETSLGYQYAYQNDDTKIISTNNVLVDTAYLKASNHNVFFRPVRFLYMSYYF